MESRNIFTEVECFQLNKKNQNVCGDVFLSKKIQQENRLLAVLSDGLGSGIKANVLGTLTASISLNFMLENEPIERISKIITSTLPVCEVRKISYSTFTIVDIHSDGEAKIIEFDNPAFSLIRDGKVTDLERKVILKKNINDLEYTIYSSTFYIEKEDRLVFMSDGVTQSGIGTDKMPFGWGLDATRSFLCKTVNKAPGISAKKLAQKITYKALQNDNYSSGDDTSCAVLYFREPRKMILCSGPPYNAKKDSYIANTVDKFKGKKVVSGGTTAEILGRELNRKIETNLLINSSGLPPTSVMDGIDLVTEGILTIGKVAEILDNTNATTVSGEGPAHEIVNLFFESDEIHFIIGTKINNAHQDPTLPIELEIRRNVIKKIVRLLEDKFLKKVVLSFI